MPKKYGLEDGPPEEEEPRGWKRKPCCGLRDELKQCYIDSDCVQKDGNTPKKCIEMRVHPSVPKECLDIKLRYYECMHSRFDMRNRFRGRKGY